MKSIMCIGNFFQLLPSYVCWVSCHERQVSTDTVNSIRFIIRSFSDRALQTKPILPKLGLGIIQSWTRTFPIKIRHERHEIQEDKDNVWYREEMKPAANLGKVTLPKDSRKIFELIRGECLYARWSAHVDKEIRCVLWP